jgi:hypothetical protein
MNEVFGLNAEAWNRWCEYKRKFKKPYRTEFAIERAQKKLASFGDWQMQAVEHCMEREWQGLFPLPKQMVAELEKHRANGQQEQRRFEEMKIRAHRIRFRDPYQGESSKDYGWDLERAERDFADRQYRNRVAAGPKSLREMLQGAKS